MDTFPALTVESEGAFGTGTDIRQLLHAARIAVVAIALSILPAAALPASALDTPWPPPGSDPAASATTGASDPPPHLPAWQQQGHRYPAPGMPGIF